MKKGIMFLVLALLVIGGSIGAYAWWDNLTQTQDETLTIGQGVTLEVDAVAIAPAGKFLVPAGVVLKANDVEEVVLTYNVKLDLEAVTALNLSVVESNVLIGGEATHAGLVNIDIDLAATTVNNADVLVTVTVTLDVPVDQTTYNAIINQAITFTLTFTATQP